MAVLNWPEVEAFSLDDFHTQLSVCSTNVERIKILHEAISCFGYDTYVFGVIETQNPGSVGELFFESNMKEGWKTDYELNGYAPNDPYSNYCQDNSEPICWIDPSSNELLDLFTAEQSEVNKKACEEGYRVGVTIPLHISWTPQTIGMSFCRKGADDFKGHCVMFKTCKSTLIAIARLFLTYFDLTEKFIEMYGLTKAHWDLLSLSFFATTNAEMATYRGVSEGTIKKQWTEIANKLGIENRNSRTKIQKIALSMGATKTPAQFK